MVLESTLLKLILGYYTDYEGDIKINNHLLHNISEDSLYKQITYVSQNNLLLEGTISDNITMFESNYAKLIFHLLLSLQPWIIKSRNE